MFSIMAAENIPCHIRSLAWRARTEGLPTPHTSEKNTNRYLHQGGSMYRRED
jgi:hypothetical protein